MKYRLLDFLVEPTTGEMFDVEVFEERIVPGRVSERLVCCNGICHRLGVPKDDVAETECKACQQYEIVQGKLVSSESKIEYPIINGIPRILPSDLLSPLLKDVHFDFLHRYGSRFTAFGGLDYRVENEKVKTVQAFGYQWRKFVDNYDYFKEIFLSFTRPFMDEGDFDSKLMLEVGCGSGRPAVAACSMGAEVVGMDISEAVDSAYQQSLLQPLLHVVQGDAYAPPFRPVFDVVYSVGVLQHIPSPRKALLGISKVVAPGKPLLLWIYGKREAWYQPIEWARKYTRRLSHPVLYSISVMLAVLSELFLLIPFRVLDQVPVLKPVANAIPGRIYARYPFRENVVGWFDRLVAPVTYYFGESEIIGMLEQAGFDSVKTHARTDASASWVVFAHRRLAE